MSQTRDEVIRRRLNRMINWAKKRREFMAKPPEGWSEDWYIRIGGNGYRAVSLDYEHPLLGFAKTSAPNIETVIRHFKKGNLNALGRVTPEKQAQAWLIKKAINHDLDLRTYLGLNGSVYNELLFALDEVSFINKRLDILAVGVSGDGCFPVSIELKSNRALKQLREQLRSYQDQIKKYETEFKKLLKACVNKEVDFSKFGRIIVWPKSKSGNESSELTKCDHQKITVIESETSNWSDIREFTFHHPRKVYPPVPYTGEVS